jgi:hypothetical protein
MTDANTALNAQLMGILTGVVASGKPTTQAELQAQLNVSLGPNVQSIGVTIDNGVATINLVHTDGQGFSVTATVNV